MKIIVMRHNDRLEEYIDQNRGAFDNAFPNMKMWADIENKMNDGGANGSEGNGPSRRNKWTFFSIVIVSLLLLTTAATFYSLGRQKQDEPKQMFFAEVEDLELFYEIQTHKMIKTVGNDFSILQNPDLEDIEANITEIKAELGDLPEGSEEKAFKALLESYQTKIMIIERLLEYHEISQPSKRNSNEHNI